MAHEAAAEEFVAGLGVVEVVGHQASDLLVVEIIAIDPCTMHISFRDLDLGLSHDFPCRRIDAFVIADAADDDVHVWALQIAAQVGDELYAQSLLAVAVALGMMMIYIAIRYRFKFAVGAVISLFHDVLFTVGMFALFGLPFDLTVLAAVLALNGYSLNDTVVVFDRIRENFRKLRRADVVEIVDISLTETLRRTVMTVATVVLVVLSLLLLGGPALQWFSVAMLIGLFAGTYSSIYIATSYALSMGLSKEDFIVEVKKEEDDRP